MKKLKKAAFAQRSMGLECSPASGKGNNEKLVFAMLWPRLIVAQGLHNIIV